MSMRKEMQENPDSPSLTGILKGYLGLILEYCQRINLHLAVAGLGNTDCLSFGTGVIVGDSVIANTE